jgi:glucose-6-phosphate 1-epimerase
VVWNPGPEKAAKMSDFDDEEYKDMICVSENNDDNKYTGS